MGWSRSWRLRAELSRKWGHASPPLSKLFSIGGATSVTQDVVFQPVARRTTVRSSRRITWTFQFFPSPLGTPPSPMRPALRGLVRPTWRGGRTLAPLRLALPWRLFQPRLALCGSPVCLVSF